MNNPNYKQCNILSIDAWCYGNDWTWNSWFNTREILTEDELILLNTPRKILKYLRDNGLLSNESKGRMAVFDDGYNMVVIDKNTREPYYAIAYGEML